MFDPKLKRLGFPCIIQEVPGKTLKSVGGSTTTITWLNKQTKDVAVERLHTLVRNNLQAFDAQLRWVAQLKPHLRMFRVSSDFFPAYTHDDWMWFYFSPEIVSLLDSSLSKAGDFARAHDIRLSFHPGQFCVLASENPHVVENSIREFEYHADIIRYLRFGRDFQDFKCNVHIGGKLGPAGIKAVIPKLSREARQTLTIENQEFTWGLNEVLELKDVCPLVLDIHHHWINSGEYVQPDDPRVQLVRESWRGVRPTLHYSLSREDVLVDHDPDVQPDLQQLKALGFTASKLRAHSNYYWNKACNVWAQSFSEQFDIMCESKEKNLATQRLVQELKI